MRFADILLASTFLIGAAACDGGDEQTGRSTTGSDLIAAGPTDETLALVVAISENLRNLPQIDVEIETTLRYGSDERSGREVLHLGPGDTIDWSGPGFHMRTVDGRLHAVIDAVPDRMVDVPLEGELIHSVEDALVVSPPPALMVMRSGAPFATWMPALTAQLLPGAQLVSVDLMDGGGYVIELASEADASGAEGSGQITFDASGLPRRILLARDIASEMEPIPMYYEVRMNPIAPEEDRPVMTSGGRQVVQSVPELTSSG
ncbi:MAG: hypothetical protein MK100_06525, partial [Phycisphaerales bacterium]|nr:hypothetical protein [Phycisphaerales bacterium]